MDFEPKSVLEFKILIVATGNIWILSCEKGNSFIYKQDLVVYLKRLCFALKSNAFILKYTCPQ